MEEVEKQNIPDDGDPEKLGSNSKDYLLTVYYAVIPNPG